MYGIFIYFILCNNVSSNVFLRQTINLLPKVNLLANEIYCISCQHDTQKNGGNFLVIEKKLSTFHFKPQDDF